MNVIRFSTTVYSPRKRTVICANSILQAGFHKRKNETVKDITKASNKELSILWHHRTKRAYGTELSIEMEIQSRGFVLQDNKWIQVWIPKNGPVVE